MITLSKNQQGKGMCSHILHPMFPKILFFWLQNDSQRETIICQNAAREIIFRNWLYCNCHTFQKLKINNHLTPDGTLWFWQWLKVGIQHFIDFDTKTLIKTVRTYAMTGPVPKCWVGSWMRWKIVRFHVLFTSKTQTMAASQVEFIILISKQQMRTDKWPSPCFGQWLSMFTQTMKNQQLGGCTLYVVPREAFLNLDTPPNSACKEKHMAKTTHNYLTKTCQKRWCGVCASRLLVLVIIHTTEAGLFLGINMQPTPGPSVAIERGFREWRQNCSVGFAHHVSVVFGKHATIN